MTARATPCQVHPPYDRTIRYNYGDIVWHHNACYRCVQYEKWPGYWKRYHHRAQDEAITFNPTQEHSQAMDAPPDRFAMLEF